MSSIIDVGCLCLKSDCRNSLIPNHNTNHLAIVEIIYKKKTVYVHVCILINYNCILTKKLSAKKKSQWWEGSACQKKEKKKKMRYMYSRKLS